MTTEEVAKKIIAYIKENKHIQAEQELYAEDVISHEQDGHTVTGLQAVIEKTKMAFETIEFHGGGVEQLYAGADCFLLVFSMDMTPKGGQRMQGTEYGFYRVKDGKVAEEWFLSQPAMI